jgi:hypothetical protein
MLTRIQAGTAISPSAVQAEIAVELAVHGDFRVPFPVFRHRLGHGFLDGVCHVLFHALLISRLRHGPSGHTIHSLS